jgi:hypothetical protein
VEILGRASSARIHSASTVATIEREMAGCTKDDGMEIRSK